jgi:hypothetical protein
MIGRDAVKSLIRSGLSGAQSLLAHLSWRREWELIRRRRERNRGSNRWFLDDEMALVEVLSSLIIPSDGIGPGAHETGVAGRLDAMVAASPQRQSLYERGLLAFDVLAHRTYAASFGDVTRNQQVLLLNYVDQLSLAVAGAGLLTRRIRNTGLMLRAAANGSLPAARLFVKLVADVKEAFYTSRICWEWLGYDGPPMPQGYPDLAAVRSSRAAPGR